MNLFRILPKASLLTVLAGGPLLSAAPPAKHAGLYALWYAQKPYRQSVLELPYVSGGQLVVQWGRVETGKGRYDFEYLDQQIREVAGSGLNFTIQFNGNQKPAWMFDEVPYHPQRLSVQVQDEKGSLMWWHGTFVEHYKAFLTAMGGHIARSPYKEKILGIRMNFNAFGTEHVHVPKEAVDLKQWIIPPGCDRRIPVVEGSAAVSDTYVSEIMRHFVDVFSPHIQVFVRNNILEKLEAEFRDAFDSGRLAWFHTSSEVEPRASFAEVQYGRFLDDCRSGKTTGFAEPWASAWGFHGGKRDDRWCSPPQWNYWRLLFDLHCGVSYIGVYADDLKVAVDGSYEYPQKGGFFREGPSDEYQREFEAAFRFARKYVGHHNNPSGSPGAWVAFRESSETRAANGIPKKGRQLRRFNGDYDFLMKRLDDASQGQDVVSIGPAGQRYGAFARRLPAGESMRLVLDEGFAESLRAKPCEIKVVYFDKAGDSFEIQAAGAASKIVCGGTNSWKIASLSIASAAFKTRKGAHISLQASGAGIHLHMVEVERVKGPVTQ